MTRVLILCLVLAGCGSGLGELCTVDQDCRSGLRCSTGGDGRRGVCIYAAVPASDRGTADRPRLDALQPASDRPVGSPDRLTPVEDRSRLEAATQ